MNWLSDSTLDHLREVADRPDLSGTKYDVREPLARGGMSTVYLARDRELDRDVAVKVLSGAADPALVERMLREARILARLEHPGIVPIHDVGTLPDGRLYYVMKLVRGERLDHYVSRGLAAGDVLRIFDRICDAVAFAHAQGVIHRDLKPANVMVGAFGEVLVMDWGVAKIRSAADPAGGPAAGAAEGTLAGTIVGTPGFMPPEQASGESHRVDARADVYALGRMLRMLLIERPDVRAARPLRAIADKASAEDPAGRYETVQALAGDLARFAAGEAVSAYPESIADRAVRFARRYRTPLLLVATYLVVRLLILLLGRQ